MKFVILFEGTDNSEHNPSLISDIDARAKSLSPSLGVVSHLVNGTGTRGGLLRRLFNAVTGKDSSSIVLEQYKWLANYCRIHNLSPQTQEVYVFGFSRGAYQACRFSELLFVRGIPEDERVCKEELRRYSKWLKTKNNSPVGVRCPHLRYIGLIDTVKTTIDDGFPRVGVTLPPSVECRHAVSIHESRRMFTPVLLSKTNATVDEQWFAGVHADLGRGYRSKCLNWIARTKHRLAKRAFVKACHKIGIYSTQTNFTAKSCDTKTLPHIVASWITKPVSFLAVPPTQGNTVNVLMLANCLPFLLHYSQFEITNICGKLNPIPRKVPRDKVHVSVKALYSVYSSFPQWYSASYRRILFCAYRNLGEGWTPILVGKTERRLVAQITSTNPTNYWAIDHALRLNGFIGGAINPFCE